MAVAAQSALPGDALYPLKRAMENAEAGFRVSDDAKGATILANATGRLDEVDQLTSEGEGSAADIEQTLNTFADQATEAVRPAAGGLRTDRQRGLGQPAARLHRGEHRGAGRLWRK